MEYNGQIFETKQGWAEAEILAHNTCKEKEGYTSEKYMTEPIETTDNKFILVELKGFETPLKGVGFNFVKLNQSIIKQPEL